MKQLLVFLLALAAAATMSLSAMAQEEETAEEAIIEIETEEAAEEAELFAEEEPAAEVTAENAVAKVGNTYYATIDEAVAAWTNGTTLTLMKDVTLTNTITLNSNEKHTLVLDEHILSIDKNKTAIKFAVKGRSDAGEALIINADPTGGITAVGGTVISYSSSSGKDRSIIKINGGTYNGKISINCPNNTNSAQLYISDGTFYGTITGRSPLVKISGGVFHEKVSLSVASNSYAQITGGRFKDIYSDSDLTNKEKFFFGTDTSNRSNYSDVDVYVDNEGYYVVTTNVDDKKHENFEASLAKETIETKYNSKTHWNGFVSNMGLFEYTKAIDEGLFYKNASMAIEKNPIGIIILYVSNDTNTVTTGDLQIDTSALGASYTGDVTLGHKDATFTVIFDSDNPYTGTVTPYPGYALAVTETQGTIVTRTYSSVTPVAKIGDTGYATLGEAIKAAQANDTIVLLANITEDVTVNKSITIDGADKNYTGTMTLNAANITIHNVNFVAGKIYKENKTTSSDNITIKGCDFDGQSSGSYAVELRQTGAIVIENCTAKDYGTGFLHVPRTNDTIAVKNVTIDKMIYAIKVDRSNGVSLENVTITNSTYGFVNSNYGTKTITVKNCTNNANYPLVIWDRDTQIVNTFKFEGDNDFGSSAFYYQTVTEDEMAYTKYVLGENATLTAVAGLNVTPELDDYVVKYSNGTYANVLAVAKIGDDKFATLAEAFTAASASADGTVIELLPVTIEEGTVKLPATLTNVTLKGVEGAVIKDTELLYRGSAINYNGVTIDGIVFDNSYINLEDWTSNNPVNNLTIKNSTFANINNDSSVAAIHLNTGRGAKIVNLTVENNIFKNVLGGSKSGIYTNFVDGNTVIEDNLFDAIAFRPFIIQLDTASEIADNLSITGNTFANTAGGRLQVLQAADATGTDAVVIKVNENAITGTTNAQQLYFYNLNEETTTADFSNNYYEYNPVDYPGKFVYNSTAASYADIIAMGVLPYYTEATFGDDGKYTALTGLVDGRTADITVEFAEVLPEVEGEITYNINLVASDESIINRLNSGDLTFKLTTTDGEIDYKIIDIAGDKITVSPVNNDANRYEFHFDTKANVGNDTAKTITIAQVKFTGYGEFSFAIENNNTNAVHTTTTDDNIVDTYLPEGKIESDGTEAEGVLNLGTGIPATYIYVPTRDLTINLSFPNTVENKAVAYQQMKVTISGGDLENAIVIDLGNDAEMPVIATSVKPNAEVYVTDDSVYQIVLANALTYNIAYNVEVSGAGYRTARYTVTMQSEDIDGKVLNFWNNVKDNAVEVEEDKASSAKNVTFLAGDIVKDSTINIYDLSAVVSYFGEINLDTTQGRENYAKYDLNRDGKIDSKDVAYVLVSWGY